MKLTSLINGVDRALQAFRVFQSLNTSQYQSLVMFLAGVHGWCELRQVSFTMAWTDAGGLYRRLRSTEKPCCPSCGKPIEAGEPVPLEGAVMK
jgi:hypothetical protein